MTNQELYELMDRFERSSLQSLKLSRQDFKIELSRGVPAAPTVQVSPGAAAAPAVPAATAAPAPQELPAITAPLVGTFYAAPSPDQPPFVTLGDKVTKGQTVCLIEAMKMMSEIPAPCDGIIEEILQDDGALVSFGAPLFRYRTV